MREILFRGKCVELCKYQEQWIEGFYGEDDGRSLISHRTDIGLIGYACDPDSIAQYTGLKDRNANKIYEADILAVDDPLLYTACNSVAVIWLQGGWYISSDFILPLPLYLYTQCSTIIGNIFDNPELAREAKK